MSADDIHLDDEQVALRTLGEPLTDEAEEHLRQCSRCTAEIDQMSAVVATARSIPPGYLESPSATVWEKISAELADDDVAPTVSSVPDRRGRWSTQLLAAASLIGVVAGAALGLGVANMVSDDTATPNEQVVAATSLAALPDHDGSGRAEIVDTKGGKELVVDVSDLTVGEGFYEVWLIDPDTGAMVGLGALAGEAGRFAIPAGLDLSEYRVVDVSIEPFDGDPIHSTDSVVRGEISV